MKKILLLLTIIGFCTSALPQDTINNSTVIVLTDTIYERIIINVIDTIYDKETYIVSYDTINFSLKKSEYNGLFEKLLEQKQKHYDSALSNLQFVSTVITLLISLILGFFAFFGYRSIKSIRSDLMEKFSSEKESLSDELKNKANDIATSKYEDEITELKDKVRNLEGFAEDAIDSFSVKRSKQKPDLKRDIQLPKIGKNPFDKN